MRYTLDIPMRLPKRRHELLKTYDEDDQPVYLTPAGRSKLEAELQRLETKDLKQAIEDVARTGAFGDRSENAEYQEAKHRMVRTHSRIFSIKERLKRVVLIRASKNSSSQVHLGSSVSLRVGEKEVVYEIVGPAESNPSKGRISHVSPLGEALLGHVVGDQIPLSTTQGITVYSILAIN